MGSAAGAVIVKSRKRTLWPKSAFIIQLYQLPRASKVKVEMGHSRTRI